VFKLACRTLLLAAGHRNAIFVAIVAPSPASIAFLAGAAALSLPEVPAILGMFLRMRDLS
jgi:voltage-gated potassium channel Kch